MDLTPFPQLPVDMARDIVEIAALNCKKTALNLTVVSKEVGKWSSRILYRSVWIRSFTASINFLRAPQKRTEGTRDLWITRGVSSSVLKGILLLCCNIVNFALYDNYPDIRFYDDSYSNRSIMKLQSLVVDPSYFLGPDLDLKSGLCKEWTLFKEFGNLTHLYLLVSEHDIELDDWKWDALQYFPKLTHLFLELGESAEIEFDIGIMATRIVPILPATLKLCVLFAAEPSNYSTLDCLDERLLVACAEHSVENDSGIDMDRLVIGPDGIFEHGILWRIAEIKIELRRNKRLLEQHKRYIKAHEEQIGEIEDGLPFTE